MRCTICRDGNTQAGLTTVSLTRGETTVVIKNVPAEICENCGEYYLTEEVMQKVWDIAETAVKKGVEVEVVRWVA